MFGYGWLKYLALKPLCFVLSFAAYLTACKEQSSQETY